MNKDIVDIYIECKDFEKAVKLSGLPTLIAHMKLLKSGVLDIKDKILYSSDNGKLGALAEQEFQNIVPTAINYNSIVKRNNPIFDFKYGDLTIDVKYSSVVMTKTNMRSWQVRPSDADLLVCFLEREKGRKMDDYEIALFPKSFISAKSTFCITQKKLGSFKVKKELLEKFLNNYNELLNQL